MALELQMQRSSRLQYTQIVTSQTAISQTKQSILSMKHVPHYDFNRSQNPIVSLRYFYPRSLLTQLERQIMTIQIELESLKNEKDRISIDRREKLEQNLTEKRKEVERLTKIWQQEKYQPPSCRN